MSTKSMRIWSVISGALLIAAGIYCLCNQDVAVMSAGLLLGVFMLISGIADLFGKGDYRFIVGKSGVETAQEVVWRLTGEWPQTEPVFHLDKSATYWTGWILAWYQWYSGQSYRRISEFLTAEKVRDMYSPYHEMDPLHFAEEADRVRRQKERTTRLRM